MHTMDSSLSNRFRQGYANRDECLIRALDKVTFARLAKGDNCVRGHDPSDRAARRVRRLGFG